MVRTLAALGLIALVGCNSTTTIVGGKGVSSCNVCNTSADCSGEQICSQLEKDDFCLAPCLFSTDCASGFTCDLVTSFNGNSISACVATTGGCSELATPGLDGGTGTGEGPTPNGYCGNLAGPNVSGTGCTCTSGHTCSANNCYNDYYCDTATNKCVNQPSVSSCSTASDAGNPPTDAGMFPPPTDGGSSVGSGSITAAGGGTADTLEFVVVGDTRSANDNDPSGYPKSVISGIYADIASMSPAPLFVLGTGDWQYADPGSGYNNEEVGYYMTARAQWKGIFWPAMGNHECDGYTASNCAPDSCTVSSDGYGNCPTTNITAFQTQMLAPIGETLPYYARTITATNGSWSAKFIMAASNYWDSTQETWFKNQLKQSTTYTFIIDHEYEGSGSPGDEAIFSDSANSPHTLHIVGHTHTWERQTDGLIVGNGGAPVTGGAPYGYTVVTRRASDGAIVIQGYNYEKPSAASSGETFCITATGAAASGTCP